MVPGISWWIMQPMITKLFVPHSVQEISDRKQIIVEKFQKAKLVGFRYFLPLVLSSLHIYMALDWICLYLQMEIHQWGLWGVWQHWLALIGFEYFWLSAIVCWLQLNMEVAWKIIQNYLFVNSLKKRKSKMIGVLGITGYFTGI